MKHERAKAVVKALGDSQTGALSSQILMEFYVILTRKLSPAVTAGAAERLVEDFIQSWDIMPLDAPTIQESLRGIRVHGFAAWDAQVWAAARLNRIGVVLSEDFSEGRIADGVRFVNPLAPSFQVTSLV